MRLDLPSHINIHPVINVLHTVPYREQPVDMSQPTPTLPTAVGNIDGEDLFIVDQILGHRKRGRGFQWLTAMKNVPQHDAQWKPKKDFIDSDGTLTQAFHEHIVAKDILPHLH